MRLQNALHGQPRVLQSLERCNHQLHCSICHPDLPENPEPSAAVTALAMITGTAPSHDIQACCRTYSTLVSHVKGSSRLDQVVSWVGGPDFDGPLIFDECHKSKNFVPGKEAQSTRVSFFSCSVDL